jgi:hypothetical protein
MKLLNFLYPPSLWEDNGTDCKLKCLWCDHFALEISNALPHQFQCWHCKQTGNAWTLIQKYYEDLPPLSQTHVAQLLRWKPGLEEETVRSLGVKRSATNFFWPVKNTSDSVVSLYKYSRENNTFYSTPKPCSLNILGLESFKAEVPVWILEGHWDYAAFLSKVDTTGFTVLGLCGSSWPSKHLGLLEGREVVFLSDNDDAGREGVISLATRMKKSSILPAKLSYLNWSLVSIPSLAEIPDKYDIRDLILALSL